MTNNCAWLYGRYIYLRDEFRSKAASVTDTSLYKLPEGVELKSFSDLKYSDSQEARWLGIAAIEAFFGWTEHVLIHVGILLGKIRTGEDVARLAEGNWSDKVTASIDLSCEKDTKVIYEDLLEVRRQVRNFMAHGAFGKHGEAFHFHSVAGAVPVNLTDPQETRVFSMWSLPSSTRRRRSKWLNRSSQNCGRDIVRQPNFISTILIYPLFSPMQLMGPMLLQWSPKRT